MCQKNNKHYEIVIRVSVSIHVYNWKENIKNLVYDM